MRRVLAVAVFLLSTGALDVLIDLATSTIDVWFIIIGYGLLLVPLTAVVITGKL